MGEVEAAINGCWWWGLSKRERFSVELHGSLEAGSSRGVASERILRMSWEHCLDKNTSELEGGEISFIEMASLFGKPVIGLL